MSRKLLNEVLVHPGIMSRLGGSYDETIEEVEKVAASSTVLVVGMGQNPYCKKVRKHLKTAGIDYRYLEYGNYFSAWQRRLALKMWSGWPTLPMVFVKGHLVGGSQEIKELIASGELIQLLDNPS